jgi:hypothetical protein
VADWDIYKVHYSNEQIPESFRRQQPLPEAPVRVTIVRAEQAYESVLADVGANARLTCAGELATAADAVDRRLILAVREGAEYPQFVTDPATVGGYPAVEKGAACPDADGDGMPDEWEAAHSLDPRANDAAEYELDSRYSNLEVYLNGRR